VRWRPRAGSIRYGRGSSPKAGGRAKYFLELLPHPTALFDFTASHALVEANVLFVETFCAAHPITSLAEFESMFEGSPRLASGVRFGRHSRGRSEAGLDKTQTVRDQQGRCYIVSRRVVWGPVIGKSLVLMMHDVTPVLDRQDALSATSSASALMSNTHLAKLTSREREVLDMIVVGKLNKTIADELGISIKTVEMHRSNIMRKLGARSVAELVRLAMNMA
jgi:DNA-binding CsgD family transcriptional regulator